LSNINDFLFVSQPILQRGHKKAKTDGPKRLSPRKKMSKIATNVYWRKTLEKPKRRRFADFENEGSGVGYARERYQHPTRLSQRTTTSNRVCKTCLQNYVFVPFYVFFYVFSLFMFFTFLGWTRVFPLLLRILRCDEEIRPT